MNISNYLVYLVVFCRKDLCEARPEMPSVFKFSDNLSELSQMDPP